MFTIHSIKRESDGEIFSIGDKIKPINQLTEEDFSLIIDDIRITYSYKNGNYGYLSGNSAGIRLDNAKRVIDGEV